MASNEPISWSLCLNIPGAFMKAPCIFRDTECLYVICMHVCVLLSGCLENVIRLLICEPLLWTQPPYLFYNCNTCILVVGGHLRNLAWSLCLNIPWYWMSSCYLHACVCFCWMDALKNVIRLLLRSVNITTILWSNTCILVVWLSFSKKSCWVWQQVGHQGAPTRAADR